MVGILDDLLAAGDGAGHAAHALLIVDDGAVVHDGDGLFGTCLGAVAAADTAVAAQTQGNVLLVLVGAGHEVGGIVGDHVDQLLGADIGAGAAAVALGLIQVHVAVLNGERTEGAGIHAGAGAHAPVSTFACCETALDGLFTGSVDLQPGLAGGTAGALDEGCLVLGR